MTEDQKDAYWETRYRHWRAEGESERRARRLADADLASRTRDEATRAW